MVHVWFRLHCYGLNGACVVSPHCYGLNGACVVSPHCYGLNGACVVSPAFVMV